MNPVKITVVQEWPYPKMVKAVRDFFGLTGYYCKFIRDYGIIARPLTNLLKDSFVWNMEAQEVFNRLKQALVMASACNARLLLAILA